MPQQISWREWLAFLSPAGQEQIVAFVREAKETRGANWIPELQAEYPLATWIIELVANYDAEDALNEIANAYPTFPIRWAGGDSIKTLHGKLRAVIDTKVTV